MSLHPKLCLFDLTERIRISASSAAKGMFFRIVGIAILLFPLPQQAGTVRISFLKDGPVLQDTTKLLTNNGCSNRATEIFQRAVSNYFSGGLNFPFNGCSQRQDDFYVFESAQALLAVYYTNLFPTTHAFAFNCFDTAIVLADGHLQTKLHPDDLSGPFLVPNFATNAQIMPIGTMLAATPRDAFTANYEPAYRKATEILLPKAIQNSRMCLTAALFRQHILPFSGTGYVSNTNVLRVLQASWQRDGLKFPDRFELVLCHLVKGMTVTTTHAGLLLHRDHGYTFIQKTGVYGPFIRLDLEDQSDVLLWFTPRSSDKVGFDSVFITFNDTKIERLSLRIVASH